MTDSPAADGGGGAVDDHDHDHSDGHDHDHSDGHDHDHSDGHDHDQEGTVRHVSLAVPEMDCPSCAGKVTRSVEGLDGVGEVEARPTTGALLVGYDPDRTTEEAVVDRVNAAGYAVETPGDVRSESLSVPGMDCPSCVGKVENAIGSVPGLEDYTLDPTTGRVDVTFDPERTTREAVVKAIESAGYDVANAESTDGDAGSTAPVSGVWWSARAKKTWASGLFLAVALLVASLLPGANVAVASVLATPLRVSDVLLLAGIVAGGQVIVRNGYYSARNLSLDIDLLMATAVLSATGVSLFVPDVSLFVEAGSLAFLFNVAELLERYSVDRARDSIQELVSLSPTTARVRRDDEAVEVPVEEVAVGETVLVQPGEKVPMDGVVTSGTSAVNEAPITGESVPVDKAAGDEVFAGTINEQGYLEVEATARAEENTIARIVDLVERAQANKTRRERFVERFSGYYTPLVVTFAVLTFLVPPLAWGEPWDVWFLRGISLLVIACPCAFVISTPVTVVSGLTSAARNGVLVKGGDHLEAMGEVEAVAFDKTGTLTTGELSVTDVVPLGENSEVDVLRCAKGLEKRSEHPIGAAIVAHADDSAVGDRTVTDFESLTGRGVRADLDGTTHYAGKPALFETLGFDLSAVRLADGEADTDASHDLLAETIPRLQSEGKTVVLVGTTDELEGVVAVADGVRQEARATVERLRDLGVATVMLTGDNERTARAVADRVGVDEFRAGLLPDEKVAAVEALAERYGTVAMVGDGINDAPALAVADVGIAMGAAGTDTAIETADVALMADDLTRLPYLYELAHEANHVIRQNIWGSLGVKALLAVGIPLGYVSVVVAILAGDVGMTTLVTGNAMRLSRILPSDLFGES